MRIGRAISIAALVLVMTSVLLGQRDVQAARHRLYVGTVVSIAWNAITIHSKTHQQNYHFVINSGTAFLRKGQVVPRSLFKVGSYVSVSYETGPNSSMIAWHVNLRS